MATVFVAGISRGIGLALARQYLSDGYSVIGSIRSETDAVRGLKSRFGDSLATVTFDVADAASVNAAVRSLSDLLTIDVLILNAAMNTTRPGEVNPLSEISDADFLSTLDVNVVGPFRVIRALMPFMANSEIRKIVLLSSSVASLANTGSGGMLAYSVSKAAVNMLGRRLHFLLAAEDFSVLLVQPGWVRTDMGGPNALIAADESARGIMKVIDGFRRDSPQFQDYQGNPIAW